MFKYISFFTSAYQRKLNEGELEINITAPEANLILCDDLNAEAALTEIRNLPHV